MTTEGTPFEPGKAQVFWTSDPSTGSGPQVAIFAMGYMLFQALLAAKKLEEEGINSLVVNVATIKPLDEKGILEAANQTKAVVTIEDHQVMGGLGGTIAELLAKNSPAPMEFIGLQDTFAESGTPKELLEKYKMDSPAIVQAARKVINRKS